MIEFQMVMGIIGAIAGTAIFAYLNTMPKLAEVSGTPAYKEDRRRKMSFNPTIMVKPPGA